MDKTPFEQLDLKSDTLYALQQACPTWINHIHSSDTWHKVFLAPRNPKANSLAHYDSCMVGECMGYSSSYEKDNSDYYDSDLTNLSNRIYFIVRSLNFMEENNEFEDKDELVNKLSSILDRLANQLIAKGIIIPRQKLDKLNLELCVQ